MDSAIVSDWAKALGLLVAAGVGFFAVFSPSYVYLRKQIISWSALVLCCFGVILLVAPMFKTVSLSASDKGLEFKLAEIEIQLNSAMVAIAETKESVQVVQAGLKTLPAGQYATIAKELGSVAARLDQFEKASQVQFWELKATAAKLDQKVDGVSDFLWRHERGYRQQARPHANTKSIDCSKLPITGVGVAFDSNARRMG